MQNGTPHPHRRPLVFGEVLIDQLPDGSATLGGAPFNVAWHLHGFGLAPRLVTRIGEDEPGEWVLSSLQRWGMDTAGVQIDPHHPTGRVQVHFENGQPSFRILADQAYDRLDRDLAIDAAGDEPWLLLYHGTLAARGATNRIALAALREASGAPVFVDANLRAPWWHSADVGQLLTGARWLKLNRAELADLTGSLMGDTQTLVASAQEFTRRYRLELMVVTDGEAGVHAFSAEGSRFQAAERAVPLVDTIGAGDAFSAVTILGLAHEWPLETTLSRATQFAAHICTLSGATPNEPALYGELLDRWTRE